MAKFHGTIFYQLDSRGTRQETGKLVSLRRDQNESDADFMKRVDSEALDLFDRSTVVEIEVEHRDGRANQAKIFQSPRSQRRKQKKLTA